MINLTPHSLAVYNCEGKEIIGCIPATGKVARVASTATQVGMVFLDGHEVPVVETKFGQIVDLPEAKNGEIFIVSILVVNALRAQSIARPDVVAPDTGPESVVRDSEGKILGVKRFTR